MKKNLPLIIICLVAILCSLTTNAQTTFTSVTSGSWTSAATWDQGSVPTNTDHVIIAAGHTVDLPANTQIANFETKDTGILDGGNRSFTITGNLILDGEITNIRRVSMQNTPGATIDGVGAITFNTSTQFFRLLDNLTINATANIQITGNILVSDNLVANPTVTNNGRVAASGDVDGSNDTETWFNNTGSELVVGGLLMDFGLLDASGTGNIIEYNSGSSVSIRTPESPGTYDNLFITGAATFTLPATLTVLDTLRIASGATLDAANNNVNVGGDFTLAGSFTEGTGTLTLNGSSSQNLSITSDNTFYNLIINNSAGIISDNNFTVSNTLTMTSGNVEMGGNTLTLGTSTANEGTLTLTSGRIIGSFERWINSTPVGGFTFPIGVSANARTAVLDINTLTTGGTVTASFVASSPGSAGIPFADSPVTITSTFTDGYWDLSAANGFAITSYNLDLTGDGFNDAPLPSVDMDTRLLIRPTAGSNWGVEGTHVNATGTIAERDAMTTFPGQYAFGDDAVCTPPVTSAITGNATVCTSATGESYSVTLNAGNNYTWMVTGGTINGASSGQDLNAITVDWGATGQIGSVSVVEDNGTCADDEVILSVTINTIAPTAITGATSVFERDTEAYSVTSMAGYTYSWMITNGTLTSGDGTNAIVVDWDDIVDDLTLSVTGNVSVIAEFAGCADAAPFDIDVTVQNTIRAVNSASWTNGSTWSTGNVPGQTDNAIIPSGFTVSTAGTQEINNLSISGELRATDNFIVNGDLVVDGMITLTGASNLQLEGTSTSPLNNISGSGSISIANGDVQIINASKEILSGSNLTLNTGDISIPSGLSVSNFGSITIANDIVGAAGSSTWTNEANSSLTIAGTLLATGTLNASATGNTVNFSNTGTITIKDPSSSTYHHLTLSGGGTRSLASNTTINGDLNLQDGSLAATASNWDILLGGNWNNTGGSYLPNNAEVRLVGTGDQTIINASGETFFDVLVNKASGTLTIQAGTSVNISNTVVFQSGIVNTSATGLLIFESGATNSSSSASSYVDGPIIKIGIDAFEFPIGDGTTWAPLSVADILNGAVTDQITAEYFDTSPANTSSLGAGLNNVSTVEYWDIGVVAGDINFNMDITFFWKDQTKSSIDDASDLSIAHFNSVSMQWENIPQASITFGAQGDITIADVSSFSPFTFASSSATLNPLPVELLSFELAMHDGSVKLEWTTASELNNDFFEVQRTEDGDEWEIIGEVDGNGTVNELINYDFYDRNPLFGESLYRLRQVDFDGEFEYSPIISLSNPFSGQNIQAYIYPNPTADGDINLRLITGNRENKISIDLIDALGHNYFSEKFEANDFNKDVIIQPNINLAKGIYFMVVRQNNRIVKQRVIID